MLVWRDEWTLYYIEHIHAIANSTIYDIILTKAARKQRTIWTISNLNFHATFKYLQSLQDRSFNMLNKSSSWGRNAIIGTLFTGKKVKARIIYFIGTAGPIVHDDSKFLEYTDLSNGILLLHPQTHSRPAMLSFYIFQQMQTRYHNLWMHERRVLLST